jgi:hypothetical protein
MKIKKLIIHIFSFWNGIGWRNIANEILNLKKKRELYNQFEFFWRENKLN